MAWTTVQPVMEWLLYSTNSNSTVNFLAVVIVLFSSLLAEDSESQHTYFCCFPVYFVGTTLLSYWWVRWSLCSASLHHHCMMRVLISDSQLFWLVMRSMMLVDWTLTGHSVHLAVCLSAAPPAICDAFSLLCLPFLLQWPMLDCLCCVPLFS